MGVIASWGGKVFEVNSKHIIPVIGFTTGFKLKSDANSDTSGTAPANTRGRELETISFSTNYVAAAGVNVRAEMGSWRNLIGNTNPLIVGGVRFGAEKYQLESADISETILDTNGVFLSATIALSFKEFVTSSEAATAKAVKGGGGAKTTGSSSNTKAMSGNINAQVEAWKKNEALNTTASKNDKVARSPYPDGRRDR